MDMGFCSFLRPAQFMVSRERRDDPSNVRRLQTIKAVTVGLLGFDKPPGNVSVLCDVCNQFENPGLLCRLHGIQFKNGYHAKYFSDRVCRVTLTEEDR